MEKPIKHIIPKLLFPLKFLMVVGFLVLSLFSSAQVKVVNPKCEYLKNPIGIDMQNPRFFWQLESGVNGQKQTAYRLLVATSEENISKNIGDAFDSKKIQTPQQTQVVYKGKTLKSATCYFWKVMVWDKDGKPSEWSETAFFETSLMSESDWGNAQWIAWKPQDEWEKEWWRKKDIEMESLEIALPSWFGHRFTLWELYNFHHDKPYDAAPLFHKEFQNTKKVAKARMYISGLGYYELSINGKKVGDAVLNPGWTNYKRTILYDVLDVADFIQEGENAIGIELGRGMYGSMAVDHWDFWKKNGYIGQPKLICRLNIQYEDGTEQDILSDLSWKVTGGPTIFDDPRMGEIYDARKEIQGWDLPGINTANWDKVNPAPAPGGELKPQLIQPIRIVNIFKPVAVEKRADGYWIDAGTNMAGWVRVKLHGKAGEKVLIFYGEKPEVKTLDQPSNFQQMGYILKGEGEEIAECKFSYKGFRYALITSFTGNFTIDDVEICQVNSDVPLVGEYECSDPTINGIHHISQKAMISNLHSIPTDCPHREKNGWLGDAVTGMEFGMGNYDLAALLTKFTRDIFDTQNPDGGIATIAPDNHYYRGQSPLWSSAAVHVPWYMWNYYGDKRLFEIYWEPMKGWVASVWNLNQLKDKPGIFSDVLSDWNTPYGNNALDGGEVYATMNFYLVLKRLEIMANILGKTEDVQSFGRQAEKVKQAINTYCFDKEKIEYHGLKATDYRQGPNAMAVFYGIVPPEYQDKILADLYESLEVTHDMHIYGGIFTVHALYELLPQLGKSELAYKLVTNDTYPSFGFELKNGATTLWEGWSDKDSHIHHFFGSVNNFLYRYLAGINLNSKTPGFNTILITPQFVDELDFASGTYQSLNGEISSSWKKSGKNVVLKVEIPVNSSAKILLPNNITALVLNGEKISNLKKYTKLSDLFRGTDKIEIPVQSGKHEIEIEI